MDIGNISTAQPTAPTPPPGGNIENRQPPSAPPPPPQTDGTSESDKVNYDTLELLREILDDYSDVSGLNSEKQSELTSRLQGAGLLEPGILFNTTA